MTTNQQSNSRKQSCSMGNARHRSQLCLLSHPVKTPKPQRKYTLYSPICMSAEPLDPQKAVLLGFGPSPCDSSTAWTAHPSQPVQDFVLPHQQWGQGEDKPPLAPGYLSVFAPSEGSRGLITLSLAVISAESSSLDGQFNQCVCVSSSTHIWKTPGCPQPSGGVTLSPLVVMVPPCSSCF